MCVAIESHMKLAEQKEFLRKFNIGIAERHYLWMKNVVLTKTDTEKRTDLVLLSFSLSLLSSIYSPIFLTQS